MTRTFRIICRTEAVDIVDDFVKKSRKTSANSSWIDDMAVNVMNVEDGKVIFYRIISDMQSIFIALYVVTIIIFSVAAYMHLWWLALIGLPFLFFCYFTTDEGLYIILKTGLRKNGYKGKIKRISNKRAIDYLVWELWGK